jgi:hypothetical protein
MNLLLISTTPCPGYFSCKTLYLDINTPVGDLLSPGLGSPLLGVSPIGGNINQIMARSLIWMGLFVGSTIGGLIPELWGAGIFSMSAIVFSFIGGIAGIWAGYKIGQSF